MSQEQTDIDKTTFTQSARFPTPKRQSPFVKATQHIHMQCDCAMYVYLFSAIMAPLCIIFDDLHSNFRQCIVLYIYIISDKHNIPEVEMKTKDDHDICGTNRHNWPFLDKMDEVLGTRD